MSKAPWRLIDSGFQTGAMNMALDEALLHSVARGDSLPVLRFYRWQPATVTLGYAQSVETDVDLDVCRQVGLDVVRRSTGGRAVLHDNEVTYAVIAPLNSGFFGNTVLDCYRVISAVLQKTLEQLGFPAQLVPGKQLGGQKNNFKSICFTAPSQYELVIEGRKVAGSAQKRHGQAFLQHGSIPVAMDLDLLTRVLKAEGSDKRVDSLSRIGWLSQWTKHPPAITDIEQVLAELFAQQLQIEWLLSQPTEAELREASKLHLEKFSHPGWNLKR